MNADDILTLFEYNYWANQRILAAAAKATAEQFLAPASMPFGGLRGTLVHLLDAEWSWRMFLQNDDWSAPDLVEADFPDLGSIQRRWQNEETEMRAYLAGLHDADLNGHRHYQTARGEARDRVLWHCLVHVVNHGTQHRSEAAALLTGHGHSPGDIDFTLFLNDYKS